MTCASGFIKFILSGVNFTFAVSTTSFALIIFSIKLMKIKHRNTSQILVDNPKIKPK